MSFRLIYASSGSDDATENYTDGRMGERRAQALLIIYIYMINIHTLLKFNIAYTKNALNLDISGSDLVIF